MRADEYQAYDAVGLAALIADGQVSAGEVLEAALTRLAEVNPKLNAVILSLAEEARRTAAGPLSGPLAGVPFLIKDITAAVAGAPTTAGSRVFNDAVQPSDSAITRLYRQAGLVIFGKTNTPELGLAPITEPELFGPTRNPWDLSRSSGGSSGGAAAAVAAGVLPAAHASDGGGSIRIPASACGLFGMKPSRGRVSMAPGGEGWGGLSIQNCVSRSVRDSAVLLDIAGVPQPGDPYAAPPKARPYADEVGRDPGRLRIAFSTAALQSQALDPECADAVRRAAKLCESLGHHVEEVTLPMDMALAGEAGGICIAAGAASNLEAAAKARGRPIARDEVEPGTWAMYQRGLRIPAPDYVIALSQVHAFGRAMAAFHEDWDVLLLSTLGSPAIPVGWLTAGGPSDYAERLFAFMPNTQPFNVSGQPAMSVPLVWSAAGLPIGLQFVGRMGEEDLLFRLAGQLEQAQPWKDRRPAI